MEILEYVLLAVLLVAAAFIIVAVLLQKSNEDGRIFKKSHGS